MNNILLTTCRDNVCRLWAQCNDENNNCKFYMCKMIEPFCLPPSINNTPVNEPQVSYVHWIDSREINRAINSKSIIENNKFQKKWLHKLQDGNSDVDEDNKNQKELKDILKDNQDLLFNVSPDGTVVIWGIQVSFFFLWFCGFLSMNIFINRKKNNINTLYLFIYYYYIFTHIY